MSDDVRNRFKSVVDDEMSTEEIFSIWDTQKKMRQEDLKLTKELEEAKKKAKSLKKQLRKHQLGESKNEFQEKVSVLTKKIKQFVSNQDYKTLFTRYRLRFIFSLIGAFFILVVLVSVFNGGSDKQATLGDSSSNTSVKEQDLPRELPSDFELLFPQGRSEADYDVVRISPDNVDPSYTYIDRMNEDSTVFRVTQQKVPNDFELEDVATNFQATNVIQIDQNKIYHGFNDEAGVQSVIFIKSGNLFTISSSMKYTDDNWVGYYLSLR